MRQYGEMISYASYLNPLSPLSLCIPIPLPTPRTLSLSLSLYASLPRGNFLLTDASLLTKHDHRMDSL